MGLRTTLQGKCLSLQGIKEEEGGGLALASVYSQAQNYYQYKA